MIELLAGLKNDRSGFFSHYAYLRLIIRGTVIQKSIPECTIVYY